jgi:hypothetical protein
MSRKNGVDKDCPVCKKVFYVKHCQLRLKTCSRRCAGILRKGRPSPLKDRRLNYQVWNKRKNGLYKHTEEWKKRMSAFHTKNGTGKWMFGRRPAEKAIEYLRSRQGPLNHKWIADLTKLKRFNDDAKDRRCSSYIYWRKQVWLRDNFTCKIANPDCSGRIEAHHILGWSEYPELRYEVNNDITLCHAHHPRRRAEEKRLQAEFQMLVATASKAPICTQQKFQQSSPS